MNKKRIWLIASKDIRSITSSSQVWLGLILLPVLFSVLFPLAFIIGIQKLPIQSPELADMVKIAQKILSGLENSKRGEFILQLPSLKHQMIFVVVNYLLGTIFLLIPCLNAMMISLHSFVGEKERRTMETLLFSPITVTELFLGKMLSAFIPTMIISLISFILFGIITTVTTYPLFGSFIFPSWNWIILMVWIVPTLTILTILINVFVSARAKGFQEAQQLGGILLLPIVTLFVGQATGFLIISPFILVIVGIILLIINILLLKFMTKYNNRDTLFEKQFY